MYFGHKFTDSMEILSPLPCIPSLFLLGLRGGPPCPRGSRSPPVRQQRLLPATGADEQSCLWRAVRRRASHKNPQLIFSNLFHCLKHLSSALVFFVCYFVEFTGTIFGLVAWSNDQTSYTERSAVGEGQKVCCIDYMLTLWFLFLDAGLRAVWCPPQWRRPVVPWQETPHWVKIMLLLACTTYLTNM